MRYVAICLAGLAACSSPPVQTSADRQGLPETTTLSGQVIFSGAERGDAVVLLYDAAHPPAPAGTGHPLSFVQLSGDTLFGGALHEATTGPFAADFTFPLVAPGTYLLAAFLDRDTCFAAPSATCQLTDFDPFFSVTREPNGGDLEGGHVDALGQLAPVTVAPAEPDGHVSPVSAVPVVLGQAMPDRPAFQVIPGEGVTVDPVKGAIVSAAAPTPFALQSQPLSSTLVSEPQPAFLLSYQDANRDGLPDVDAHGIPQLWPKVILRKVAEPDPKKPDPLLEAGLRDENDLDDNGLLDDGGASYENDGHPSAAVLAASYVAVPTPPDPTLAFVPTQLYALLANDAGAPDVTKVVPLAELPLSILPEAFDARDPASPTPLATVPPGRYAIIVEQSTGQTWRVPNELAPPIAQATGLPAEADQLFWFTVPEP